MKRSAVRLGVLAGVLTVALAVAACAERGAWTAPGGADGDRLRTDNAYCRARANEFVEREAGIEQRASGIPSAESSRTLEGSFARMDVERQRRSAYDRCMTERGYIRSTSE